MKKRTKQILIGCATVVVIAIVAFVGFVFFFVHSLDNSLDKSLEPVFDVSRYSEIKAAWPKNLVSHFPAEAPGSAVFHFQPGFLQGGSSLQLKVPMTPSGVRAELDKVSGRVLATYHGGDVNDHQNLSNGIPTTFFFTSGTDSTSFPEDYTIMVIEAHDQDGGFPWNHGSTAGLAVSTQRNMVVYWAEDW